MRCLRCGEEMDKGYIFMQSYGDGWLYWSKHAHTSAWKQPDKKLSTEILKFGVWDRDREHWLREAYRCGRCGLIAFEEKYTLPNEEKVEDRVKQESS